MDALYLARKFTDSIDEQDEDGRDQEEIPQAPGDPYQNENPPPPPPPEDPLIIDGNYSGAPSVAILQSYAFGHISEKGTLKHVRAELNAKAISYMYNWFEQQTAVEVENASDIPPKYIAEHRLKDLVSIEEETANPDSDRLISRPMIFFHSGWPAIAPFNTDITNKPVATTDGYRFDTAREAGYIFWQQTYQKTSSSHYTEYHYWDNSFTNDASEEKGAWTEGDLYSDFTLTKPQVNYETASGDTKPYGNSSLSEIYTSTVNLAIAHGYNDFDEDPTAPTSPGFARLSRMGFYIKAPGEYNGVKVRFFFSESAEEVTLLYSWGIPLSWGDVVDNSSSDMTVLTTLSATLSGDREWVEYEIPAAVLAEESTKPLVIWVVTSEDYNPDYENNFKRNYIHYMPFAELYLDEGSGYVQHEFQHQSLQYHEPSGYESDEGWKNTGVDFDHPLLNGDTRKIIWNAWIKGEEEGVVSPIDLMP